MSASRSLHRDTLVRQADELYEQFIRALLAGTPLTRVVELRNRFDAAVRASNAAAIDACRSGEHPPSATT